MVAEILKLAKSPKVVESALAAAQERLKNEDAPVRDEMAQISSRISEFDKLFEEWPDQLDRRLIDEAQFRQQNSWLIAEREKLVRRLEELETKAGEGPRLDVSFSQVKEILRNTATAWDNLQFEEKREILRLLVEKISVYPDRVDLHIHHLPPRTLQTRRAGRLYR